MKIPQHVAIIMDGNGRWARKRNLPNLMGHREGVKAVSRITEECARLGVKALTLYTFSTENWSRDKEEVSGLMSLLSSTLKKETKKIHKNNIRLNVIGDIGDLPGNLPQGLKDSINLTRNNDGMILTLAINYGGREEILTAVHKACSEVKDEYVTLEGLSQEYFSSLLYTNGIPDPDLIVRTSGEQRISNFLLWQSAYSEFYFTDKLWPDFTCKDLMNAFEEYDKRERRFGK